MKNGLVLEGGAMRGLFTTGVLDVFLENGIEFDGAVAVSAGAVFGCNIKSKQIGRAIRYNMAFSKDKRYCGFHSLLTTGNFYNAEFCYRTIPRELDIFDTTTYKENPMDFYAVTTNAVTGEAVYHNCLTGDDTDIDWLRASASMPIVSHDVVIDGTPYLDGGIADSIPISFAKNLGYDKTIVILTQPKGYKKEKFGMLSLAKKIYKERPALISALATRHERYNAALKEVEREEKEGCAFVLRPEKTLPVKRTERSPQSLLAVYMEGRRLAIKRLHEIKEFLN